MDKLHLLAQQTGDNRVYKVYVKTSSGLVYKGCHSSFWMAGKQKALLLQQGHQVQIHEVLSYENN